MACRGRIRPRPQGRKFSKQLLVLFLGDLVSKIGKDVLELGKHHGSVAVFVIKLKKFNVVVVGSGGVGGVLGSVNLLDDVIEFSEFLAFFISLAKTDAHLLCGVHARAYMTSPRKNRSSSPLPSQS